jgi:ABC-type multidrug transport system ATPase subunit
MDEAEQLSDRIAFLKDGRFIRIGDAEELKRSIRFHERVSIRGENLSQAAKGFLSRVSGISQVRLDEGKISFQIDTTEKRLGLILKMFLENGATIEHIEISEPTLGDVFVELASQPHSE